MLSENDIVSMIMHFATRCADPAPAAIRYVHGTRGDLNRVTSGAGFDDADAATPAVLVEATGNFTWHHRGLTPARSVSKGRAITLVIDERTGVGIDVGIAPEPHDLSSLGQIHHPAVPTGSD